MQFDFDTWGPLTTLAVVGALIVLLGGAVEVAITPYSFGGFLNDLKPVAAALAGGAAIGRGVRLAPHAPTTRLPRARRARARKDTP
jgi:hypothetical protein